MYHGSSPLSLLSTSKYLWLCPALVSGDFTPISPINHAGNWEFCHGKSKTQLAEMGIEPYHGGSRDIKGYQGI